MTSRALEALGGKIRVRVAALIFDRPEAPEALLLVEHRGLFDERPFWTPPGGAVQFGEGLTEALVREVREETGLTVAPGPLTYTLDFVRPPLHAVSFYFRVAGVSGTLRTGHDPEMPEPLIRSVRFIPLSELSRWNVVPTVLPEVLTRDLREGFPPCARYLGTLR